jgi:hypothetical protein
VNAGFCPRCGVPWVPEGTSCVSCGFAPDPVLPTAADPIPAVVTAAPADQPAPHWGAPVVPTAVDQPAPPWGAPVAPATADQPAPPWGAPVAPTAAVAGKRRSPRLIALAVLGIAAVAVLGFAAFTLLSGGGPAQMASDLVTRVAARDSSASAIVDSDASLRDVANQMGVLTLPGSVTVTVENLVTKSATPSLLPSAASGETQVTATYTLKWSGNGHSGKVDQQLTATSITGKDGKTHLIAVVVSPALAFDFAGYFGPEGTTAADATTAADDLRAGSKWLPGVTVATGSADQVLTLPDHQTVVPGHLTSWHLVTAEAVPGNKKSWDVTITANGRQFLDLVRASKVTAEPVAAQVSVGDISEADAIAAAAEVDKTFWDAVNSGNVAKANALISVGPKFDAGAAAVMKGWGKGYATGGDAVEGTNGPEVAIEGLTLVMANDGSWTIDSARSNLIKTTVKGNGHVEQLTYRRFTSSGTTICTANISIRMVRVEFYTGNSVALAVFGFTHTGTCDSTDYIISAKIGWKGNSAGVSISPMIAGSDSTATGMVYRYIPLPPDVDITDRPIWVKITEYGAPGGSTLPGSMTFRTL